jgi:hypothetical protein
MHRNSIRNCGTVVDRRGKLMEMVGMDGWMDRLIDNMERIV